MKKYKVLNLIFSIAAPAFVLIAIFVGFAPAVTLKYEGTSGSFGNLFEYAFKTGDLSANTGSCHIVQLLGFILMIVAIVALVVLWILFMVKKLDDKFNLIVGIITAAFLLIAAIFMFCTKVCFVADAHYGEYKSYIHLGAGAICSGIFAILASGCTVGYLATYKYVK